jgi:hypothetical protein
MRIYKKFIAAFLSLVRDYNIKIYKFTRQEKTLRRLAHQEKSSCLTTIVLTGFALKVKKAISNESPFFFCHSRFNNSAKETENID